MNLSHPKEPTALKAKMRSQKDTLPNAYNIEWDGFVVWAGTQNELQSYLWKEWKAELSPAGFTWPKFTKLLRYKTDRMVYWYRGLISWDALLVEIIEFVDGKYGQGLAKR